MARKRIPGGLYRSSHVITEPETKPYLKIRLASLLLHELQNQSFDTSNSSEWELFSVDGVVVVDGSLVVISYFLAALKRHGLEYNTFSESEITARASYTGIASNHVGWISLMMRYCYDGYQDAAEESPTIKFEVSTVYEGQEVDAARAMSV